MASGAGLTEKTIATQNQQHQRPQPVLKCPRCDSLNTKFCYYNNYNLSQPRHFCKACKRYWTRGGTLRNVPVGGGCRKNKRIKRSSTFTTSTTNHDTTTASITVSHNHNLNPNSNPDYDHHSILSNSNLNPLYGILQQNPKFPRFNTRVSSANDTDASSRFDFIQPQMSSLGLGFSSSLVSSYPSMFSGGLTSSSTADPSMASLLISSSIHQQQQPGFTGFSPYGDGSCSIVNDIHQMEGTKNNTGWNNSFNSQQVDNDQQIKAVGSSDPASFLWTMIGSDGGEWLDPTSNIGSSVSSLI